MWRDYDDSTLAEARERGLPLLVLLGAELCPGSRALREGLAARAGALEGRYVCALADKDAHPELDAAHRGAGWPTLVLLDGEGRRTRRLEATEADAALDELLERAPAPAGADRADRYRAAVERIGEVLLETSDPDWGGWGARQKFPHPDALHFLLVRWAGTGDDRMRRAVNLTLHSMQGRPIHDTVEGGFYRYATARDWSAPSLEKPLLSNAKRLLAYAEAYQVLGEPSFRATALAIVAWMERALLDEDTGAFRDNEELHPEAAARLTLEGRREAPPSAVDPRVHAERNAWAAVGLLKAGLVLDAPAARARALGVLDFLVQRLFDPARGVFAYWNGTWNAPGELRPQAAALRALVEAVHTGGANRFLAPAEAVAAWTCEHLDAPDGSFRADTHQRPTAALERSAEDLKSNALMAEALLRLGVLTGDARWAARARAALDAFLGAERPHGYAGAGYGRALDLVLRAPVHVVVVGRAADPLRERLQDAALRPYVASRVALTVDPEQDAALCSRLGLLAADTAYALVRRAGRTLAITSDPGRLPALMAGSEV